MEDESGRYGHVYSRVELGREPFVKYEESRRRPEKKDDPDAGWVAAPAV